MTEQQTTKSRLAIQREINRLEKVRGILLQLHRPMDAQQAHRFGELGAAYQALSWALGDGFAMAPSKCYAVRKGKS